VAIRLIGAIPATRVVEARAWCHQGFFTDRSVMVTFWRSPASIWCDHDGSDRFRHRANPVGRNRHPDTQVGGRCERRALREAQLRLSRSDAVNDLPAWRTCSEVGLNAGPDLLATKNIARVRANARS
jgi:hypothetical protein